MAAGATSRRSSRELGFGWKRLGLPLGKEPDDENMQFFARACIQA
jgi:hypothetical protein